jgi:anti-sigma factor RsiW
MCPDHQFLSVYLDGEMPSPWKEKMESHLEQCPRCRRRLESYRLISASVAGNGAEEETHADAARVREAQERVWRNLEERERFHHSGALIRRSSVWRRRISIPFPAVAAAAAVLVIATAALWVRRPAEPALIPNVTLASGENLQEPEIVPIADMNGVLQYLGREDEGDILILRLPESSNFMSNGEPAILKAADYSRRRP